MSASAAPQVTTVRTSVLSPPPTTCNGLASPTTPSKPAPSDPAVLKRKRLGSNQTTPKKKTMLAPASNGDANHERVAEAVKAASEDLLLALKGIDPIPSILDRPLPDHDGAAPPPQKRAKLSSTMPGTIRERLEQKTYTRFSALLADIYSVAQRDAPDRGMSLEAAANNKLRCARAQQFVRIAKELVFREVNRKQLSVDLVEQLDSNLAPSTEKIALTVMGVPGPMFTSSQKPEAPPLSSKATATNLDEDIPVVLPVPEVQYQPLVSVGKVTKTRAIPYAKNASTIGETFPPPPALPKLQPPKQGQAERGLRWGGRIGLGGVANSKVVDMKDEPTGQWLRYKNRLPDKYLPDPHRKGLGLNPIFVGANSSFAPSRDDYFAQVPARIRNLHYWELRGKEKFATLFATEAEEHREVSTPEFSPLSEVDDDFFKHALDLSVEETPQSQLDEVTRLMSLLQYLQHTRLASFIPSAEAPLSKPSEQEASLARAIENTLVDLSSRAPPYALATIDGDPDSDLNLCTLLPSTTGNPIVSGSFPEDPKDSVNALATVTAATGVSPAAPVAPMMQSPSPARLLSPAVHAAQQNIQRGASGQYAPYPAYASQQQQSRTRGQVPPPQGLAAVGVVAGYRGGTPAAGRYGRR